VQHHVAAVLSPTATFKRRPLRLDFVDDEEYGSAW
jgi:hypothetical protein